MRLGFGILTLVFFVIVFMAAQDRGKNRILKLEELSQTEIGNLEEHGPHPLKLMSANCSRQFRSK